MAFDAYFMKTVLEELRQTASGARVEKIHQPTRDTVILHLRCQNGREKLLLAANPASPRLHLTQTNPENPDQPPMFCMLLRKHLSGARLAEIQQPPMERMARFVFDCTDEMGYPVQKQLVAELMGKTCNLYLLDDEGRILDCLRRVGLDESSRRAALPGLLYQPPEPVEKLDPETLTEEDFIRILEQPGADELAGRLMDTLGGLSPLVCREAALATCGDVSARLTGCDTAAVGKGLYEFFSQQPIPCYTTDREGTPRQFAFCPLNQYGGYRQADSFGSLLDMFYAVRDQKDSMRQKSQTLRKSVSNLCQRIRRKLTIQEKELAATYDRERLRQLGDIVTANIHRIQKGHTLLQAEDFYDPDMTVIDIPLSPILSPQQNAGKFYKDYARMKNAEKELTHQLELGEQELQYLESVLEELERAGTDAELEEIRQELSEGGYIKGDSGKKRMKQKKTQPMRFESTDGYPIYVGRNNRQNDELTFKLARKDDIWLHAQKVHGSHVIISCGGTTPPDDTITQAAQLAAFYSEHKGGQNLPVDVTPVKQVKKAPGSKPGMVIYHTYKTIIVNPYKEIFVDPLNAAPKAEE